MSRFVNFVLYQSGWFACVLGVAWNLQWLGIGIALCLVGLHFWLATDRSLQIKLGLTAAVCGLIIDSGQLWAGVFTFPRGSVVERLPPPAIAVLWLQFATTFRYSMSWLSRRYVICGLLRALRCATGFLCRRTAWRDRILVASTRELCHLGVVWSFAVPLLVFISDRWALQGGVVPNYRWPSTSVQEWGAREAVEKL